MTARTNALAETIIGLYKTELIRRRGPWKGIDDVEYGTLEWVDWFNHRRLLEPIGHVPPAEFEEAYYSARAETLGAETAEKGRISSASGTNKTLNGALRASYGAVFGADGTAEASDDAPGSDVGLRRPASEQRRGGDAPLLVRCRRGCYPQAVPSWYCRFRTALRTFVAPPVTERHSTW